MTTEIQRFLSNLSILDKYGELAVSATIPDRFYHDGEPSWPGAPTAHDADNQRRRLVKRLRRFAKAFPGAAELADRLASCETGNPCNSGACPVCMRVAQRLFVGLLSHAISHEIGYKTEQVVAISMMSPRWRAPLGHLSSLDVNVIYGGDLADIFGYHYFGSSDWIVLGTDVSLNDDTLKGQGVCWQIQLYGMASVDHRDGFGAALRENFDAASDTVRRPVRVAACDGSAKALSYAFKTNFVRRVAYVGDALTRKGEPRKCWRTRKVSLKAKEEVELRLWLNQIGLAGRVLWSPWGISWL
jgi:hypothetical protein